jgi:hypothetical protein
MILQELKDWIETLPEEFLQYSLVNGEVGVLDDQYHYRLDKPVTTLLVDEEHQEIVILNDSTEKPEIDGESDTDI